MRRGRADEDDVGAEPVARAHGAVNGGIAAGGQIVHRRTLPARRAPRRVALSATKTASYAAASGRMSSARAARVAEPVDPGGAAAVPERGHHRGVHLGALEHQHQRRRGAGDGAGQPVVQSDPAEAAEPAAGADQVERRHAAAQPLERAAAEGGVGVERVVEGADEEDAGSGAGRHETSKGCTLDYNPRECQSVIRHPGGVRTSRPARSLATVRRSPARSLAPLGMTRPAEPRARAPGRGTADRKPAVEPAGAEKLIVRAALAPPGRRRARRSRPRRARWRAGARSPARSAPP